MTTSALFDTGIFDDSRFDIIISNPPSFIKSYTGGSAFIEIGGEFNGLPYSRDHTLLGLADFNLNIIRNAVTINLIGHGTGKVSVGGSLSVEGSLQSAKFATDEAGTLLEHVISGVRLSISGATWDKGLHFYFISCAATNFDLSMGDADTISTADIDFKILDPAHVKLAFHPDYVLISDTL